MTIKPTPRLTIFTPAWNRADLLPRLFHSIASQAPVDGSIEWLVIDDGSTDDTPAVLADFANQRPDLVRWLRVDNGGKHRAINRAAHEARAEWILLVDSDDALAEGAIADVLEQVGRFGGDARVGLIRGLKSFPEQGDARFSFRQAEVPLWHWQWISSQPAFDSAEAVRRSALMQHPFPEHDGERFMAESWLWHALDSSHHMVCVNNPWVDCWYQEDGLSASALRVRLKSLRSTMDVYRAIADSPARWGIRARASINGWRYWFHARKRGIELVPAYPLLYTLAGWLMYKRDRSLLSQDAP